jgi:hypothetical protein
MIGDFPDVLPVQFHRVFGKIHKGMVKDLFLALIEADGNAGKIADDCTQILNVQVIHMLTSFGYNYTASVTKVQDKRRMIDV